MKTLLFNLLLLSIVFHQSKATAQVLDHKCGTPAERSAWLIDFQKNIDSYQRSGQILYVPISIHSVATDGGDGHVPMQLVLEELCKLNEYFQEAEIQFFLEGEINYINNTEWYEIDNFFFGSMMEDNSIDNTINCYTIGSTGDFSGFYSDSGDGVVMARWGFNVLPSLFAHELGHYFSLPHTFFGWEGSSWNYSTPAPEFINGRKVERVDSQDCEIAGDGFCDTSPDYLSFGGYNCNFNGESFIIQRDPTGVTFQTDCSLIMSYASSSYQFSSSQIDAMRANLEEVRPYLLYNQNPSPEISNQVVSLISPEQGAIVNPDEALSLEWEAVPGATHYLVEVTSLPYFSVVYDQYIVEDNTLMIDNLAPNKNYRWRVRPYNPFYTCAPYSDEGHFSTGAVLECSRSQIIGTTIYGLQTNSSVCNRISQDQSGNIMATWTMGYQFQTGWQDRGTGYNRYDATTDTWGAIPSQRLEANRRTGWPNHIITDNGTELIVTHEFISGGTALRTLRRQSAEAEWIEGSIPTNTPQGVLTARVAVSGETVHVIAPTLAVSFGGVPYQGVMSNLLYYRSPDRGNTWDIIDRVIPGLGNDFMVHLGGLDRYAIDARGDVVAIGVFSQTNDVKVFKSTNGGENWTNIRVADFPIDMYTPNQGYNPNDLPPPTPEQPHPLAILTTDNSGSVLIDKDGQVHAFYGQMYIRDNDPSDGIIINYLRTDGIAYWNETFGADSTRTIANIPDVDGNGEIDIPTDIQIASYNLSMTTTPSPAVDSDNNLYLAFSSVMEGPAYRQNLDGKQYRHILLIHSQDGGETWSDPFDISTLACEENQDIGAYTEAIYPSMLRDIESEVKLIYQENFEPGISLADTSYIRFVQLDISELGVVSATNKIDEPALDINIYPNPTNDIINIAFNLPEPGNVHLELYDLPGALVLQQSAALPSGRPELRLDINHLPSGVYILSVNVEGELLSRCIVIQHL